jgi:hypothetical protein
MDLNYFAHPVATRNNALFLNQNSGTNGPTKCHLSFNGFPLRSGYAASKHAIKDI